MVKAVIYYPSMTTESSKGSQRSGLSQPSGVVSRVNKQMEETSGGTPVHILHRSESGPKPESSGVVSRINKQMEGMPGGIPIHKIHNPGDSRR